MKINYVQCYFCGACASVCPLNLIDVLDKSVKVREGCTNCGMCSDSCPVGAINIVEE